MSLEVPNRAATVPMGPSRLERRREGVEMALTCYFWHIYFFYFFQTSIFSKFALHGVLHVILQPEKKLDPKRDTDEEVMALLMGSQCLKQHRTVARGPITTVVDQITA